MIYKVKIKNTEEFLLLDDQVYEWLTTDLYYAKLDLVNNLRRHSSGCAVFQKSWRKADGNYKVETIYPHVIIAEKYLADKKTGDKKLVGAKNGDKMDCRLENLIYRTRSLASRQRRSTSDTGYTGVYKEHNRYRAVISVKGKSVHIGMFDTAEAAAMAYNKMSKELYGPEGKQNKIKM
jgi:hypothetical protein